MIKRIVSCLLAAVMLAAGFSGCAADAPGNTTAAAEETTAAPTTVPKREVTIVGETMRHMSYNISGSLGAERLQMFYMEGREAKKNNIKAIIEELDPDTISIQEVSEDWRTGLPPFLDNKYAIAGATHEEVPTPEFWLNPILYKVDTFTCLDEGVFFLGKDLKKEGSSNRSASFALLERIADGELVFVMSTHLSAQVLGSEALRDYNYKNYLQDHANRSYIRDEHVALLRQIVDTKLAEYAESYDKEISVVLSGDFNIDAWTDDKYDYEYTRLQETLAASQRSPGLADSAVVCANLVPNQTRTTWQTYRLTDSVDPYLRIDYIFVSNNLVVDTHAVYNTPYEIGDSSDHHPVYTDYFIGH